MINKNASAEPKNISVEYVGIDTVRPDPSNPRQISAAELEKLKTSITTFGLIDPIIVRLDMLLIGGHQRLEAARQLGFTTVPVIKLDLTTVQTKALNLALNQIGGDWDAAKLETLVKEIEAEDQSLLKVAGFSEKEMNALLREDTWMQTVAPIKLEVSTVEHIDKDSPFQSTELYDFPPLLPNRMGSIPATLETWAPNARIETDGVAYLWLHVPKEPLPNPSVFLFYTDDGDFDYLWEDPERALPIFAKYNTQSVVMPDFSLYAKSPQAVRIYNAYRSRYVSRYWQERGIAIIPSITAGTDRDLDMIVVGFPKTCPVVAISGQSIDDNLFVKASRQKMIDRVISKVDFETLLVYGAKDKEHEWFSTLSEARHKKILFVTSFMYQRLKSQSNMNPKQRGSKYAHQGHKEKVPGEQEKAQGKSGED